MEQCVHFSCTVAVKLGHMYTRRKKLHLPAAESARRESLRLFMCRFVDWSCFSSLNKRCILNPSQRVGVCWVGTPGARAVPARSVVLHAWLRCGAAGAGAHCICHSAWPAMLCSGWLRSEWLVPCHPFCGLVRRTSICLCAAKHVPLTSWRTRHRQGGRLVEWWWTGGCGTGMRTRAHHRLSRRSPVAFNTAPLVASSTAPPAHQRGPPPLRAQK